MTESNKPTFSISFSEYSTFQQCPHKWLLNYGLKIPSDSNEELIFGSTLHDTIETVLTHKVLGPMAQRGLGVEESIFKDHLKTQITEIKDLNLLKKMQEGWVAPTFIKQSKGLLSELNIFKRFKDYEFVDVEIKLDGMPIVELDNVILTYKGFIDLVLKHKVTGRYLIIDWKTSRKPWDINAKEADHNFYTQLKLYKHFYSLKKGIPIDMIDLAFYNLPREEPRRQKQYDKEIEPSEISTFINDVFIPNCQKLYEVDHFHLNKMRFTTKKNFCHRCPYNSVALCNDTDEFQIVGLHQANF
jgi:hypothetical protein